MNFDSELTYIFNPSLRFRKDGKRLFLYTLDDFFFEHDKLTPALPQDIIMLLLFQGNKTFNEVAKDFAFVTGSDENIAESEAIKILTTVLNNLETRSGMENLLVPIISLSSDIINETLKRYPNPQYFIIPADEFIFEPNNLRLSAPLSVNWNVMTACGFHCQYCYHPLVSVNNLISLERLKIIFAELKGLDCESILLTGGDPMLRPDIDDVILEIAKSGLKYCLSTKSVLNDNRIKFLRENANLHGLQISLDSVSQSTVSKLLGIGDNEYVKKIIHMINSLQKNNIEVRVKSVLTSYNADELDAFLKTVIDLGIRRIQITPYGRSGTRHNDKLFTTAEQLEKANQSIAEFRNKYKDIELIGGGFEVAYDEPVVVENITSENIFTKRAICNAGRFSMTIMPNGEVFVCEQLPYDKRYVLGDLRTQSVQECWNGELMQKWLSPPDRNSFAKDSPCRDCPDEFYTECHRTYSRCLRFIYEHTGDTITADIKCPRFTFEKYRMT